MAGADEDKVLKGLSCKMAESQKTYDDIRTKLLLINEQLENLKSKDLKFLDSQKTDPSVQTFSVDNPQVIKQTVEDSVEFLSSYKQRMQDLLALNPSKIQTLVDNLTEDNKEEKNETNQHVLNGHGCFK